MMDRLTWLEIILIIMFTGILIKDIFTIFHHGKLIIKTESYIGLTVFLIIMLFLWNYSLHENIRNYYQDKKYGYKISTSSIYNSINWIALTIYQLFRSLRGSEIRENGIYKSGFFYKWSKIQSCIWISETTIQFKVKSFILFSREFAMPIKDEFKLKVDEILKEHLTLQIKDEPLKTQ